MPSMLATMYDRIKKHYNLVQDLPLNRPFAPKKRGLSGFDIKTLRADGIIRQTTVDGSYIFTDAARDELQDYEPTVESPCSHRGIRNLGNGRYTCGVEDCDVEFGREEAAEALGVEN